MPNKAPAPTRDLSRLMLRTGRDQLPSWLIFDVSRPKEALWHDSMLLFRRTIGAWIINHVEPRGLSRRVPGSTIQASPTERAVARVVEPRFESSASQNSTIMEWWSLGDYPDCVGLYGEMLMVGRESPRCWDNVPAHAES